MGVNPVTLLLRVVHTLGGALMFAYAVAPYMFKGDLQLAFPHTVFMIVGVAMAGAGIANAVRLKPKEMKEKAGLWRLAVHGGKIALFLAFTPLCDKTLAKEQAQLAKLVAAVGAMVLGAWARFYREAHTPVS